MKKFLLGLLLVCGVAQADTTGNLTSVYGNAFAVNQALSISNANVQINSANIGWDYDIGAMYCSGMWILGSCTSWSNSRVRGQWNVTDYNNGLIAYDDQTISGRQSGTYSKEIAINTDLSLINRTSITLSTVGNATASNPTISFNYTVTEVPVVTTPTFYDDTYVHVPLQFGFPFYGRTFTNSWMHSNGVVSFLDPAVPLPDVGYNPAQWAYCCGDRPTTTKPQFQYMIAPLWTDLYPTGESSFRTEGTSQYQRYYWTNLGEISNTSNKNTFSLDIRPTGSIGVEYTMINGNQNYWVGTVGLPSAGEINEIYYGRLGTNNSIANLQNWTVNNATGVGDQCLVDPLSSPTCAGYDTAMCTINPLYSTSCAGYAAAYYTQQCSLNALYDVNCPGYAAAYLDYQCSLDALYSTTCSGYEQAYLNQQCSISPLYSSSCSGYQTAVNECSSNPLTHSYCPSYQTAVNDCSTNGLTHAYCPSYDLEQQLCSTDPLSNNLCSGYTVATNECNSNPLLYTYCTDYTTTLSACSTNPQSNTLCPGYNPNPVVATVTETATTAETATAVVSDPVVNNVVTTTTTATTTATAPAAAVQLTSTAPTATTVGAATETTSSSSTESKKEEAKEESTNDAKKESSDSSSTQTASSTSEEKKTEQPTMRQQIAAKRKEAATKAAVAGGAKAAEEMNTATSMEAQVAVQNVVMQAMGFTPGFQAYNVIMPDGVGYKPFTVYNNQKNVDNRRLSRGLTGPSERLHEQMVAAQWEN